MKKASKKDQKVKKAANALSSGDQVGMKKGAKKVTSKMKPGDKTQLRRLARRKSYSA